MNGQVEIQAILRGYLVLRRSRSLICDLVSSTESYQLEGLTLIVSVTQRARRIWYTCIGDQRTLQSRIMGSLSEAGAEIIRPTRALLLRSGRHMAAPRDLSRVASPAR